MDIIKRQALADKRRIASAIAAKTLAEYLGPLERGCEIYGLSKGQFSLIDLIEYALGHTGPADVVISTWTAAGADIEFAYRIMRLGKIRAISWLVDFSFPSRQPAYCAALRETFGDDCIRITKNHAKFVLISNDEWNLVLRTSMNLNQNRRLENFEISDDARMVAYLRGVIAEIFAAPEDFNRRPIEHIKNFEALGETAPQSASTAAASKLYGDGAYANDLRRVGVSYVGGGDGR